MLEDKLRIIGLSDHEIEVYLALQKLQRATYARLAKNTTVKRTTIYGIAKSLVEKGLIIEDTSQQTIYLHAKSPEELLTYIENEEKKLSVKKKLAREIAEQLQEVRGSIEYDIPKVRFVSHKNFEEFLYKQAKTWDESLQKTHTAIVGFQDHTFVEKYKDWIEWYFKKIRSDAEVRLLSNKASAEDEMKESKHSNRHIKLMPGDDTFTASVQVMGDYVSLFVTKQEPHYMVEIHDAVLAHNLREYFNKTWKLF